MDYLDYSPQWAATASLGPIQVTPATLILTANDASMDYGSALPVLGYTVSGFAVPQDNLSNTTLGTAAVNTTATSSSLVADYPITVYPDSNGGTFQVTSPNYFGAPQLVNGTLTISRATPNFTINIPANITFATPLNKVSITLQNKNAASNPSLLAPTGNVTVTINYTESGSAASSNGSPTLNLSNGVASWSSCSEPGLPSGCSLYTAVSYYLRVDYVGDNEYATSSSSSGPFDIKPFQVQLNPTWGTTFASSAACPALTVPNLSGTSIYEEAVLPSALLDFSPQQPTPTGYVILTNTTINQNLGTQSLVDQSGGGFPEVYATFSVPPLSWGNYDLSATYQPDSASSTNFSAGSPALCRDESGTD